MQQIRGWKTWTWLFSVKNYLMYSKNMKKKKKRKTEENQLKELPICPIDAAQSKKHALIFVIQICM